MRKFHPKAKLSLPYSTQSGLTNTDYYTTEVILRSVRKITDADCLLNGPRLYDIRPAQYDLHSKLVGFDGKIFMLISMKFLGELNVQIEKFRTIKCVGTPVLLFLKVNCIKERLKNV